MDLAELIRLERGFAAAFDPVAHTIEELWPLRDRVAPAFSTRAAHRGEFNGIAATGREVVFPALVVHRLRDGASPSPGARPTSRARGAS